MYCGKRADARGQFIRCARTGERAADWAGDGDDGEDEANGGERKREAPLHVVDVHEHLKRDAEERREADEQQPEEERRVRAHASDEQQVARHEVHEAGALLLLFLLLFARRVRRQNQEEERYPNGKTGYWE